jgi:hypothetical protein
MSKSKFRILLSKNLFNFKLGSPKFPIHKIRQSEITDCIYHHFDWIRTFCLRDNILKLYQSQLAVYSQLVIIIDRNIKRSRFPCLQYNR